MNDLKPSAVSCLRCTRKSGKDSKTETDICGLPTNPNVNLGKCADLSDGEGASLSPDLDQLLLSKLVVPEQLCLDSFCLPFTVRHRIRHRVSKRGFVQ